MALFIGYLVLNLCRVFLYIFEITLWRNKKIDPTAKKVKRRTFAKIFINLSEVALLFIFLA
jgi:predicted small integral membrane protein